MNMIETIHGQMASMLDSYMSYLDLVNDDCNWTILKEEWGYRFSHTDMILCSIEFNVVDVKFKGNWEPPLDEGLNEVSIADVEHIFKKISNMKITGMTIHMGDYPTED